MRPRTIVLWVVSAVVLLAIFAVVWVGVRGLLARNELQGAVPLASKVQTQVLAGDGAAAQKTATQLADHAARAARLTGDPVWRALEIVPWLGGNLSAVRQLAAATDEAVSDGVQPLAGVAGTVRPQDFSPVDGVIDLKPLVAVQPKLASASAALVSADRAVHRIDTSGLLGPVRSAATQLTSALDSASNGATAIDNAVRLAPAVLGADGPRNYLLLFQNPAELRATGGIPGALALIHTENGKISLVQQASSADFPHYASPVLPLPVETRGLYGDNVGEYIQDVTLTPDFPRSAALASEMWKRQFGLEPDGVLSVDPVTLGYLLKATGPITLPTGDVLTSGNAVQLLLSEVYARYTNPAQQDEFFAGAAASVFTAVSGGKADPVALITALARAGSEHRVLIWSAHKEDQSVLSGTTLAGGLPISTATEQRFGVYLNDGTGAKMDTYLHVTVGVAQVTCRKDRRPDYGVEVTLTNTAPADAATSLVPYVTGGGSFGVTPGNIKTVLSVYGVRGMQNLGVMRDGKVVTAHPSSNAGYPVTALSVELAPGESTTLHFGWLGTAPYGGRSVVQSTPAVHADVTNRVDFSCESRLF